MLELLPSWLTNSPLARRAQIEDAEARSESRKQAAGRLREAEAEAETLTLRRRDARAAANSELKAARNVLAEREATLRDEDLALARSISSANSRAQQERNSLFVTADPAIGELIAELERVREDDRKEQRLAHEYQESISGKRIPVTRVTNAPSIEARRVAVAAAIAAAEQLRHVATDDVLAELSKLRASIPPLVTTAEPLGQKAS